MLDNAPIHQSKETQAIFRQISLPTLFLPPYSPTLAPVELFFRYLKSKIRSLKSKNKTVYGTKSGDNTIFNAWWEIYQRTAQKRLDICNQRVKKNNVWVLLILFLLIKFKIKFK